MYGGCCRAMASGPARDRERKSEARFELRINGEPAPIEGDKELFLKAFEKIKKDSEFRGTVCLVELAEGKERVLKSMSVG